MLTTLVTPAFCRAESYFDLRKYLAGVIPKDLITSQWCLLNKYPLPSVEANEADLLAIAREYDVKVWDSGADLGLHESLNKWVKAHPELHESPSILFGVDADVRPADGFFEAAIRVMEADPDVVVVAPSNKGLRSAIVSGRNSTGATEIGGVRCWQPPRVEMYTTAAFRLDWIMETGGFYQPRPYYGFLESALWPKLERANKKCIYLPDYADLGEGDDSVVEDQVYVDWKLAHAQGKFLGSFGEYIEKEA